MSDRISAFPTEETAIVVTSDSQRTASGTPALIVVSGPSLGRQLKLGPETVHIGRHANCEFQLQSTGVSRRHAAVEYHQDGYVLRDLGSKNGTLVNGVRIQEHSLRDGDAFTLGKSIIKYTESGSPEARYLRHLLDISATDALTGVANRRHFEETLRAASVQTDVAGTPLSLILLDIDHFKSINDTHGHPAGDAVLKEIAEVLKNQVREADLVGRVGGEEFGILCAGANLQGAKGLAERIRSAVEEAEVESSESLLRVTVSLGVATRAPRGGVSTQELYKAADDHLLAAKRSGRNRVIAGAVE